MGNRHIKPCRTIRDGNKAPLRLFSGFQQPRHGSERAVTRWRGYFQREGRAHIHRAGRQSDTRCEAARQAFACSGRSIQQGFNHSTAIQP